MASPVFTVGHSTHPIDKFCALLTSVGIEALADVRSTPYSRRFPEFNKEALKRTLSTENISYVFLGGELGGRSSAETALNTQGRVLYREMAKTRQFQSGLERLQRGAARMRVAVMCSEGDPLFCHRGLLISRELLARGTPVHHIHRDGLLERHGDAEDRLLALLGRAQATELFRSPLTALDEAYSLQEEKVAWVSPPIEQGRLA